MQPNITEGPNVSEADCVAIQGALLNCKDATDKAGDYPVQQ